LNNPFQVQVASLVNPDVILIPVVRTWAFVCGGLRYPVVTGESYGFGWGRRVGWYEKTKALAISLGVPLLMMASGAAFAAEATPCRRPHRFCANKRLQRPWSKCSGSAAVGWFGSSSEFLDQPGGAMWPGSGPHGAPGSCPVAPGPGGATTPSPCRGHETPPIEPGDAL
jgi:hypothetical protein